MIGEGLGHLQQHYLAALVCLFMVRGVHGKAGDEGITGSGVVEVEVAVGGIVGIESQAQQPLLISCVVHPAADVEKLRCLAHALIVGEYHDPPCLQYDENPVGPIPRVGEMYHSWQGEIWKRYLQLQGLKGGQRLSWANVQWCRGLIAARDRSRRRGCRRCPTAGHHER